MRIKPYQQVTAMTKLWQSHYKDKADSTLWNKMIFTAQKYAELELKILTWIHFKNRITHNYYFNNSNILD